MSRLSPAPAARPLDDILEKEWQQQVVLVARTVGFRLYHTHDSRRSQPGFPDLVALRDRVIYLELKREKGTLSDKQREWVRALVNAGAEVYVIRPRHLDQIGHVLAARRDPLGGHLSTSRAREAEQELLRELRKEIG